MRTLVGADEPDPQPTSLIVYETTNAAAVWPQSVYLRGDRDYVVLAPTTCAAGCVASYPNMITFSTGGAE